jgi:hypothetical protein
MSRDLFPVYPEKGDYIKFKSDFEYTIEEKKIKVILSGEVGLVMKTTIGDYKVKDACSTLMIEVGMKSGKIYPFDFTKFVKEVEVIKANSPAYRILYGQES